MGVGLRGEVPSLCMGVGLRGEIPSLCMGVGLRGEIPSLCRRVGLMGETPSSDWVNESLVSMGTGERGVIGSGGSWLALDTSSTFT